MIRLNDIVKSYGKQPILKGIDLKVERGHCVGLVGSNGSGKSTLLSIMSGAAKADSGTIFYNDKEMKTRDDLARYAAFVPQDNPLIEELSVYDNLKLWYADSPVNLDVALQSGLPKELGVDQFVRSKVRNLSGGQKKRLSIACALAFNSPILLLDEPAAALDLVMKEEIRSYFRTYLDRGGTVVISSHEVEELAMCDELYHLYNGKLTTIPVGLAPAKLVDILAKQND